MRTHGNGRHEPVAETDAAGSLRDPCSGDGIVSVPDMAIGSDVWPGLAKLAEECGELQQVIGKLMAYPEGGEHPDGAGNLADRLQLEMGDVWAAIHFVTDWNPRIDSAVVRERHWEKVERFAEWHKAEAS